MKLLAWCTALLVFVGVAVALDETDDPATPRARGGGALELASLRSFDDCGELLGYFQETARTAARAALDLGARSAAAAEGGAAESGAGGDDATATAAPEAAADGTFSGTNLQEAGVDEPDLVKTDGEVIVAVAGGGLQVLEASPSGPVLRATVDLPEGGSELLLTGDRVTVLTRTWREERQLDDQDRPMGSAGMEILGTPVTVLTSVDVSDPAGPRVLETRSIDGDYVRARMVGTTVRVVLRSQPQLGQPGPLVHEGAEAPAKLRDWYDDAIDDAPLAAWVPTDGDQPLVACDAVSRPSEPAGLGTVTVLTIDVTGSLEPQDAVAVVADAETVYASTDRLYVATTTWGGCCGGPMPAEDLGGDRATSSAVPTATTTELHAFDTSGPTTAYLGSGRVAGRLLNSFALSEHEGTLRVATTVEDPTGGGASESAVITLVERDGALVELGRLGGLGRTEQIYAVRYQGDVAYVVTFRQTDPLYTLDLSDPAAPRLLGELKVPGYSAYLHPAEPGRLIAVGQDATDEGRTQGTQVSTFDVADLAAPTQEARLSFPDSSSPVEWDHRAFLWWAPARVAVVPLETYTFVDDAARRAPVPFLGAVAVDVGADGQLAERGRVSHQAKAGPESYPAIARSLIVGDTLYTLSEVGLLASDLATLAERGWVAF